MNHRTFEREEVTHILKEFFPFINPLYLPINLKNKTLIQETNNLDNVDQETKSDKGKNFFIK